MMITKRTNLFRAFLLPLFAVLAVTTALCANAATTIAQHIAVPAYIFPGPVGTQAAAWTTLIDSGLTYPSSPGLTGLLVVNVLNGPDYQAYPTSDPTSPDWAGVISRAHAAGIKVLGYVDSGYFGTTSPAVKTRLGASDVASWRSQIEHDINAWYTFYGASGLDGIFFDEGQNACGTGGADTTYSDLYASMTDYVKTNHPGARTAVNPGAPVPSCFQNSADILVTFEGSYACYAQDNTSCPTTPAPNLQYQSLSWNPVDPQKIWHLIYNADDSNGTNLPNAISLSKSRGAGNVYITPDTLPNPWDTVPFSAYWAIDQSGAAPAGTSDTTAPTRPGTLDTVDVGYVTASLDWEISHDSGSGVVGYDVYQDGEKIVSVPQTSGPMASVAVDGLQPNTEYSYVVKARDGAGNVSAASNTMTFTTQPVDVPPPRAPGSASSSAVTYTSVNLSWTASHGDDPIVAYDVYQGTSKVQTLPSTGLSTTVIGLSPGTAYAFTIRARDDEGNVSPASATVNVTTTALSGSAISSPAGNYTASTITYDANFLLPFAFRRVFIDSDNNSSTGYSTGSSPVLGADFLIENNTLFSFAGSSHTDYTWNPVATVTPTVSGSTVTWTINTSALGAGAATSQPVVFQADGFEPGAYSSVITLVAH
jgi:chitodextrinase